MNLECYSVLRRCNVNVRMCDELFGLLSGVVCPTRHTPEYIRRPAPDQGCHVRKSDHHTQPTSYIGLTIDEHLQWKQHIEKTANKCSRTIGIINKLKHYLPTDIKLLLYQTLLNPHLNYCILVWGYRCARLIKIQKKALRIINLSGYNSHGDPLFKSFNILKLPDMLRLQELKLYYKFVHNKLPHYLQQLPFHLNHDIHSHNTRTRNDIHILPARICQKVN